MVYIKECDLVDQRLKKNTCLENLLAGIAMGMLTGWCYILFLVIYPCLVYLILVNRSVISVGILTFLIYLTLCPLEFKQQEWFMKSYLLSICRNYFPHTIDVSNKDIKEGQKYLFCEFPHAVFPMGQFLCAPILDKLLPRNEKVCGIGADIVFSVPVLRQVMSWIGTRHATREGIRAILSNDSHVTVLPGGIAEMYLVNSNEEAIYLRKRHNTIKMAIQEGLHIVPEYCFGNTKLFTLVGGKEKIAGDSTIANVISSFFFRLSRKLRISLLLFYGCFLTVPRAVPLHMARGKIIEVKQCDNPTDEQVQKVLDQLIKAVEELYRQKKPEWETRPLVIY